jgi:DMSO/TMAO reductase YedYZ molybdopterin-dependent catalytic subunit
MTDLSAWSRMIGLFFFAAVIMLSAPCICLGASISVSGDVKQTLSLSADDLKKMPSFAIKNITLLEEKNNPLEPEQLIAVASYKGVLLRDLLEKAGMKFIRKFEPGVIIRVRGADKREVVFSFGEIFYSSIGRSVLLSYQRNGKPIDTPGGIELVIATDTRSGRMIKDVREILVERVNIELHAYTDKERKISRPPSSLITLTDSNGAIRRTISRNDLAALPTLRIDDAVMTGDCEGFRGVYSFEGPSLKALLESAGVSQSDNYYRRYVVISSSDGFSAVYSFGEIFNSRLSDNSIIAWKKNGKTLTEDGYARSVVREDSTGGRSVRRISRIEIH